MVAEGGDDAYGSPPLARGHALGGTISRPMPLSLSDTPDVGSRSSDRALTLLNQEAPWQLPLAMPQGPMHLPLRAIAVFHTAEQSIAARMWWEPASTLPVSRRCRLRVATRRWCRW